MCFLRHDYVWFSKKMNVNLPRLFSVVLYACLGETAMPLVL